MKNINKSIVRLVENHYSKEQVEKVKELINDNEQTRFLGYQILAIGLENILVDLNEKELEEYYNKDIKVLNELDKVLAEILITLTIIFNKNVKEHFIKSISLTRQAPELDYLASEVENYLTRKNN